MFYIFYDVSSHFSKTSLYLITPGLGDVAVTENTNQLIKTFAADPEAGRNCI